MLLRTGLKSVVCNVWSDAAREASAMVRKENAHGKLPYQKMSIEDKRMYAQGQRNYRGLSDSEKKQYDKDWNSAQKASNKANSTGNPKDHVAAAGLTKKQLSRHRAKDVLKCISWLLRIIVCRLQRLETTRCVVN